MGSGHAWPPAGGGKSSTEGGEKAEKYCLHDLMQYGLSSRRRIKKESDFVRLLKKARKIKNDFFFVLFEK
jgi:hypothetical protein